MKLIIASNNAHKLEEIKAILGGLFEEILSMREAGIDHETVEDGSTFMENAIKKAREIAEISGCCAIADDSGICVDALDGAPGIYSARFSGVHGDDEANNDLLLEKLSRERPNELGFAITPVPSPSPGPTAASYKLRVICLAKLVTSVSAATALATTRCSSCLNTA